MKKLITLCLALAGMVCTVNAKTIYFANNFNNINSLTLYLYNNDNTEKGVWPGEAFPAPETYTIDGYSVYALDLGDWEKFIIAFKFNNSDVRRQSKAVSSSSLNQGDVIDFSGVWDKEEDQNASDRVALTSALTVYDYSFKADAAEGVTFNYIYFSQGDNKNADWPGQSYTVGETFTYKSFLPSFDVVIFNKGNGQPQTSNLWAEPGENKYYIASLANDKNWNQWGEAVKTNSAGYATYVNSIILTIPNGIAFFATDDGNGSATALSLTKPAANTPMLIKGNGKTIYHFATSYSTAESPVDNTAGNAFQPGTGTNLGSGNETDGYNYILNGDAFYLANNMNVASNKAYLHLSAKASARVLKFAGDEETGINAISTSKDNADVYYNLRGQRIANPAKGIYIKDGKKVIIK